MIGELKIKAHDLYLDGYRADDEDIYDILVEDGWKSAEICTILYELENFWDDAVYGFERR